MLAAGTLLRGEFRPGGVEREWCDPEVLRLLRRRSLARLRREIEPVEPQALARFLPRWQGVGERRSGVDRLAEVIAQLEGTPLPASVLERDVLPARVCAATRRALLDELGAAGEVVWVGPGSLGRDDGRVALYRPDRLSLLLPRRDAADASERARSRGSTTRSATQLRDRGASFYRDILAAALRDAAERGERPARERELLDALWDLVWATEVTNDTFAPLRALRWPRTGSRAVRGPAGHGPATLRQRSAHGPARGRRPLVARQRHDRDGGRAARRNGADRTRSDATPTRCACSTRTASSPATRSRPRASPAASRPSTRCCARWRSAAASGAATSSRVSAARSSHSGRARPAARRACRRRRRPRHDRGPAVLAATDPANPYGAALAWPRWSDDDRRPLARGAGAYVVLVDGEPVVYLERGGKSLQTLPAFADRDTAAVALNALRQLLADGRFRSLQIERVDGVPVADSPHSDALAAAGFQRSYRGWLLRA